MVTDIYERFSGSQRFSSTTVQYILDMKISFAEKYANSKGDFKLFQENKLCKQVTPVAVDRIDSEGYAELSFYTSSNNLDKSVLVIKSFKDNTEEKYEYVENMWLRK